ncbi:hypothetical protein SAMN05421693_1027 [Ectothiorhodospira magna]|uniref:DUF721 domain-containing protein n=1 Tax=Ectothiorhodospira magna TaxID=867345 RepID=A0A1H8Z8D4_9GAMM|nr:DUF721 domain-containing protein [Ectothiorhodospira magna]SEP60517.1 hypothetical protein SAMN05421693_1027 [Ectothiorhodospira magna]
MRRTQTYLNPDLLQQAALLERLTRDIKTLLPPGPREHCWVSGIQAGVVTLVTDSGVWATPLRYRQRDILARLQREHGIQARTIRIRVRPAVTPPATTSRLQPPEPLTTKARQALLGAANTVTDPELGQVLRRLAMRRHTPVKP